MAKGQEKDTTKLSRRSDDAMRLAAIRWLVMKIEQVSIEVLATDRDKFAQVEDSLRDQVQCLRRIGRPVRPLDDDDCPGGYILCRDGLCAPMCDEFEQATASGKKRKKRR